jgi:hypothetical protein
LRKFASCWLCSAPLLVLSDYGKIAYWKRCKFPQLEKWALPERTGACISQYIWI